MTSKIELKDMRFYAYHGVAPQENIVGNTFIVDLLLTTSADKSLLSDNLKDTINYAEAYETVKQEMSRPSKLLEHIAGRILYALKNRFPQLKAIRIKISKLNPPFGGEVHSAAVILEESWNQ